MPLDLSPLKDSNVKVTFPINILWYEDKFQSLFVLPSRTFTYIVTSAQRV
ncbi:MAG: hypothetical protein AB4080_00485 [Trichodesmium sp.]